MVTLNLVILTNLFVPITIVRHVECRGTAVMSGGGGSDSVCVDCATVDTEEEMQVALVVLSLIMMVFLAILACQCCYRLSWEMHGGHFVHGQGSPLDEHGINLRETKGMRAPPYQRNVYAI